MSCGGRTALPGWIETVLGLALNAALAASILSLGYLLYGVLFGPIPEFHQIASHEDRLRIATNISLACRVLVWAGPVAALVLIQRYYLEGTLQVSLILLGAALLVGVPYLLAGDQEAATSAGPLLTVLQAFRLLGSYLIAGGVGASLIASAVVWRDKWRVRRRYEGATGIRPGVRGRIYATCWQTPAARTPLCPTCPAFLGRKSCWRRQSGCYCDPTIGVKGRQQVSQAASGKRERLTQCCECEIYAFHQRQKYRFAAPAAVLGSAYVIYRLWGRIDHLYSALVAWAGHVAFRFSFGSGQEPEAAAKAMRTALDTPVFRWMILISLSLGAVISALRLVEHIIFDRHL
jgi:hypothetical protein